MLLRPLHEPDIPTFFEEVCVVVFDDVLVYSDDWETHLQHLSQVLSVLQQNQFVANRKKCVVLVSNKSNIWGM